jgi:hypothetical protein
MEASMKISYIDKFDQQDPAKQLRGLTIWFDEDHELRALNRAGTPERIVKAAVEFVKTFLKENADAHRTD